jgi:hypothetical protein
MYWISSSEISSEGARTLISGVMGLSESMVLISSIDAGSAVTDIPR